MLICHDLGLPGDQANTAAVLRRKFDPRIEKSLREKVSDILRKSITYGIRKHLSHDVGHSSRIYFDFAFSFFHFTLPPRVLDIFAERTRKRGEVKSGE